MVKENGLVVRENEKEMTDPTPVFEVYETLSGFQILPQLSDIYMHYLSILEGKMASLRYSVYPDEFYDGNPESSPQGSLPDSIKGELSAHLRMNYDMEIEDIQDILDAFSVFYFVGRNPRNKPVVEVW